MKLRENAHIPWAKEGRKDNLTMKNKTMKNKMRTLLSAVLCVMTLVCLTACTKEEAATGVWADATYTEDTELGEGSKTVKLVVEAEDKKVTFTIHTDEAILGDALLAHNLIDGEAGDFGMYIKKVNGITADYDVDQTYWGFYQNGEYMMTGVDGTEFADGDQYELVRTK